MKIILSYSAAIDQSLALANKVIDAKDELIAQLRKDN